MFFLNLFVYLGIIITTCGFVFTWTPYAVTFFISAFQGKDYAISPLATFICACFAKSSVIWIPLLYISTSTHFQFSIVNHNALDQPIATTRVDPTMPNTIALTQRRIPARMNTLEGQEPTATNE